MKLPLSWICEHLGIEPNEQEIEKNLVKLGMEVESIEGSVIEISIPANRGDCLSLEGLTRELANSYGMKADPIKTSSIPDEFTTDISIEINNIDKCSKYIARSFSDVDNNVATPTWMKETLESYGMQSLSPVVDITNYVMLEMGQPLHAFDYNKIGKNIFVRLADHGERLLLLDGREVDLTSNDLVIADENNILAVAGIMGGENSSIDSNTTNVVLECAWFEPIGIRLSARNHKLQTDSSYRFERGVDFNLQERAIDRASQLIIEICGAKAGSIETKIFPDSLPQRDAINFDLQKAQRVLGINLDTIDIEKLFSNLKMKVHKLSDGNWSVSAPSHRYDIEIEEDLIEEVARVISYDSIEYAVPKILSNSKFRKTNIKVESLHTLKNYMTGLGFTEVISYSFISPSYAKAFGIFDSANKVVNPISEDLSVMRTSLWPSLAKIADYNKNRQEKRIKIYEVGNKFEFINGKVVEKEYLSGLVWGNSSPVQWAETSRSFDFYDLKGDIESLLSCFGLDKIDFAPVTINMLHPGQSAEIKHNESIVGSIGQLHPKIIKELSLPKDIFVFEISLDFLFEKREPRYEKVSKYPSIKRDISLIIKESISCSEVRRLIFANAGTILKEVNIVDRYCGDSVPKGNISLAFSLLYQDTNKTLKDEEIDASLSKVLSSLKEDLGVLLRDYNDAN